MLNAFKPGEPSAAGMNPSKESAPIGIEGAQAEDERHKVNPSNTINDRITRTSRGIGQALSGTPSVIQPTQSTETVRVHLHKVRYQKLRWLTTTYLGGTSPRISEPAGPG
jgi:hypothetical protein